MIAKRVSIGWVVLAAAMAAGGSAAGLQKSKPQEWKSGLVWPEPKVVEPGTGTGPPADALVLFDGKNLSQWHGGDAWKIEDGYAIARKQGLTSKEAFGDCQ